MVKSGQSITRMFRTRSPVTGVITAADSTPLATLYVNGVANGAFVTVTQVSGGLYKFAVTLPSLSPGDQVEVVVSATVSGVADAGVVWGDTADTKRVSDLNDAAAAPSAAANASAVRSEMTTELGRIDAAISTRSTLAAADVRAAIGLANANLDTQLADIPTGAEINARTLAAADYATASAIAEIKAKTDNLPASPAATGDIPPAATIADTVWDEVMAGHQSAGTTGKALSDAADAMDVQVPGNYAAGTAGYIIGMLRAGVVSLVSPVAPGTNELSIVAGASYTTHVPINIEIPTSVVSLTGATVQFKLHTPKSLTVTATVSNAGGAGQAVTIALTAAQTADLGVAETLSTEYSIIATWTGPEVYPFVYRNRATVYKPV